MPYRPRAVVLKEKARYFVSIVRIPKPNTADPEWCPFTWALKVGRRYIRLRDGSMSMEDWKERSGSQ